MPGRRDPRRPHDVHPEVALVADGGLARVEAHADAHLDAARPLVVAERALRVNGAAYGVARADEREEERVALRVDLGAAGRAEALADEPPVVACDLGVVVAELLQQACRALDVREGEGDRPGGEARSWKHSVG